MSTLVEVAYIVELASKALLKNGLNSDDTESVIAHLLDCELSGKSSHGFYRLPGIVKELRKGASYLDISIENEAGSSALVNGNGKLGLVAARKATDLAIEKALQSKIGLSGAYNYVGTTGSLGYYTKMVSDRNLIGIAMCNSESAVTPWGGKEAVLGTNPIAVSVPSTREPIIADLATSSWSYGSLALAMRENRRIPEGVVLDENGNPSTDPNDADNGCMLPMAGHKGFALGLIVELLAGPLVKAKAGYEAVTGSDGFLIIVIDPEIFVPVSVFKSQVDSLIDEIKQVPLAPGASGIRIPGEQSSIERRENLGKKQIKILAEVFAEIEGLARDVS